MLVPVSTMWVRQGDVVPRRWPGRFNRPWPNLSEYPFRTYQLQYRIARETLKCI